jgi:hypothetical protein
MESEKICEMKYEISRWNPVGTSPLLTCVPCTAHFILHDVITQIVLGEEYRSSNSQLQSPPVICDILPLSPTLVGCLMCLVLCMGKTQHMQLAF